TPGPFAEAQPLSVTQKPGSVRADSKDARIGATFAPTSTSVHAEGRLGADVVESKAFRSTISPDAQVLPKNADFLAATGLDMDRAEQVIARNREATEHARQSYVRRGGLPNAGEWGLSVNVVEAGELVAPSAGALQLNFKRSRGAAEAHVDADSALGRRIRATRGQALSSPVLDFMERFFQKDFGGVRLSDGAAAQSLNRDLGAEAFTTGNDIFVASPAPTRPVPEQADRIATLGHELSHVVDNSAAPAPVAAAAPAPAARAPEPSYVASNGDAERRAREAERKLFALMRREPQSRSSTPRIDMTHTGVSSAAAAKKAAQKKAEIAAEKNPVQKKKAADTQIQTMEKSGSLVPKPWEALFPRPPKRDLTPLVYQIWNKIKKDLSIEMERRSGGF
ncbi:MAG TPA: DUF4157 domain-containing protein, partial [Planctomycetota bacterium]|nr:DUF4157 domain-containing protein [Planctomycetota bacterium]